MFCVISFPEECDGWLTVLLQGRSDKRTEELQIQQSCSHSVSTVLILIFNQQNKTSNEYSRNTGFQIIMFLAQCQLGTEETWMRCLILNPLSYTWSSNSLSLWQADRKTDLIHCRKHTVVLKANFKIKAELELPKSRHGWPKLLYP